MKRDDKFSPVKNSPNVVVVVVAVVVVVVVVAVVVQSTQYLNSI